jgi:H+/Cl- antiporter ClcA
MDNAKFELLTYVRKLILSICAGLLAGLAATVFLVSLDIATNTRILNTWLIWFLPLAGLFIGLIYHYYGKDISIGTNLILDEIHDPKKIVPITMAPLILISTVLTHLFGGSAGREGTAVQMGASLSDQLSRIFNISPNERKLLLMAGAGAGFGAAIGTPWAGAIFGMEVLFVGRFKIFAIAECVIASFTAYYITLILHAPHSQYPSVSIDSFQFKAAFFILIAGIYLWLIRAIFYILHSSGRTALHETDSLFSASSLFCRNYNYYFVLLRRKLPICWFRNRGHSKRIISFRALI